jgi:quercetin dioxygenase-like cupin family protein
MGIGRIAANGCVVCVCVVCVYAAQRAMSQTTNLATATPMILEKNEGERRVWRGEPGHAGPGAAFVLKVDPKNGGSSHLVFGTGDLAPGEKIDSHRHPGADEILFLETGTARVHLGDSGREVHGGTTVFIPAGTSISVSNIGRDVIHLAFVFSAPGFEEFMRDTSVREGEKNVPLSKDEDNEIQKKHLHDVIYNEP